MQQNVLVCAVPHGSHQLAMHTTLHYFNLEFMYGQMKVPTLVYWY